MDTPTRVRILEHAAAELLESESNSSVVIGALGTDCEPLVVTALGCSVVVALGHRASVLTPMASLRGGAAGPRSLAAGCERTLRAVHGLPAGFIPTLRFSHPPNLAGFLARLS